MDPQISKLNIRRGLFAALALGAMGAAAPVIVLCGNFLFRWWTSTGTQFNFDYDYQNLKESLIDPVIGCASVCASAGWATYAPRGSFRFVKSLTIIFAVSVIVLFTIETVNHFPPKALRHVAIRFLELTALVVSPMLVAVVLTLIRVKRVSGVEPSQSPAPRTKISAPVDGNY